MRKKKVIKEVIVEDTTPTSPDNTTEEAVSKNYFGQREEKALVDYIDSKSPDERQAIYNRVLKKPFQKMVESILRKYPIHIGNYDIKEIEMNGLSHLIENMVKFNPDKLNKMGQKVRAFSYCQTRVRNYFKDHGRKSYKEKKTILSFENYSEEILQKEEYLYEIDKNEHDELQELINNVVNKIRDRIDTDKSLKKNEIIVGDAIINVLENWHVLFLEETMEGKFNKKVTNNYQKNKILLFLKEQTGLSTKEIRLSMKSFKDIYFIEKTMFYDNNE
jgi:hypothetical protein